MFEVEGPTAWLAEILRPAFDTAYSYEELTWKDTLLRLGEPLVNGLAPLVGCGLLLDSLDEDLQRGEGREC